MVCRNDREIVSEKSETMDYYGGAHNIVPGSVSSSYGRNNRNEGGTVGRDLAPA